MIIYCIEYKYDDVSHPKSQREQIPDIKSTVSVYNPIIIHMLFICL